MKWSARLPYARVLQRVLEKNLRCYTVAKLTTAMNLERSFGPIYTRGLLRQGQSAIAVLGVNLEETQASIDAALTFGILWLDSCRQEQAGKLVVEGLSLFEIGRASCRERVWVLVVGGWCEGKV